MGPLHPMAQASVPCRHFSQNQALTTDQVESTSRCSVKVQQPSRSTPDSQHVTLKVGLQVPIATLMSIVCIDYNHNWIMVVLLRLGCEELRVRWHCHKRTCRKCSLWLRYTTLGAMQQVARQAVQTVHMCHCTSDSCRTTGMHTSAISTHV